MSNSAGRVVCAMAICVVVGCGEVPPVVMSLATLHASTSPSGKGPGDLGDGVEPTDIYLPHIEACGYQFRKAAEDWASRYRLTPMVSRVKNTTTFTQLYFSSDKPDGSFALAYEVDTHGSVVESATVTVTFTDVYGRERSDDLKRRFELARLIGDLRRAMRCGRDI